MQRAQSLVIGDYKSSEDGLKYPEGKLLNECYPNNEDNHRYASSNDSSIQNESADEEAHMEAMGPAGLLKSSSEDEDCNEINMSGEAMSYTNNNNQVLDKLKQNIAKRKPVNNSK